jgi:hypothetical protein
MTNDSPNYFVIPVFRDEQGDAALGSRFSCRSHDDAIGLAQWFVARFLGAAIQAAGDLKIIAMFGEVPVALRAELATLEPAL